MGMRTRAKPDDVIGLASNAIVHAFDASTFYSRLRGLHAVWPLAQNEALIIRPCSAIHTMSMPCAIDVIFVNELGVVLRTETVPRFAFRRSSNASAVIELSEGAIEHFGIAVGDVLTRHHGAWK